MTTATHVLRGPASSTRLSGAAARPAYPPPPGGRAGRAGRSARRIPPPPPPSPNNSQHPTPNPLTPPASTPTRAPLCGAHPPAQSGCSHFFCCHRLDPPPPRVEGGPAPSRRGLLLGPLRGAWSIEFYTDKQHNSYINDYYSGVNQNNGLSLVQFDYQVFIILLNLQIQMIYL